MRLLTPLCSLLLLAVMFGGCERQSVSRNCPHDTGMKTYQQWRDSVSFPYTAPQLRKERIVKNFDRVGVGSTKDEFVAALGEPDYEREPYPKESNRSCGYEFMYYFEKPEDLANEIRDKKVEAFFSTTGKATWVVTNISGLSEKGSPTTEDKR
jgi:hypothetical protein